MHESFHDLSVVVSKFDLTLARHFENVMLKSCLSTDSLDGRKLKHFRDDIDEINSMLLT